MLDVHRLAIFLDGAIVGCVGHQMNRLISWQFGQLIRYIMNNNYIHTATTRVLRL